MDFTILEDRWHLAAPLITCTLNGAIFGGEGRLAMGELGLDGRVETVGLRKILETYFFIFFLPRGMDIQCTIKYHFKFSLFNSTSLELPMAKVT